MCFPDINDIQLSSKKVSDIRCIPINKINSQINSQMIEKLE